MHDRFRHDGEIDLSSSSFTSLAVIFGMTRAKNLTYVEDNLVYKKI